MPFEFVFSPQSMGLAYQRASCIYIKVSGMMQILLLLHPHRTFQCTVDLMESIPRVTGAGRAVSCA